jgi:hypothetical protein
LLFRFDLLLFLFHLRELSRWLTGQNWEHPPSVAQRFLLAPSLWLLFLPLTQSFPTSRVDIVGSNLLVTRPVTSARSFSLASSSTVASSSACSSSFWDFQRISRSFVTRRIDIRSNCSSDSSCDFRLLSLFFFRVCYLFFLFRLCSPPETVVLSFPFLYYFRLIYYADRNYISSSLSSSSSVIVSIGDAATEDSANPELIVSFGVQ